MFSYLGLCFAALIFVGSHFGLSAPAVRSALIQRLGEKLFLGLYALIALGAFSLLLIAYQHAPHSDYLWYPSAAAKHVSFLLMPLVFILFVCALWGRNPTAVQQEDAIRDPAAVKGIFRITRHPMMWGFSLWGALHVWMNGDFATVVLAGSLFLLALLGTFAMDHKKKLLLGADWNQFAAKTSNLPFLAILQKRNQFVFAEIGWLRIGLGLILFVASVLSHTWLSGGVSLF